MRVAILGASNSIHTVRWANGLAERGLDIHLISMHQPLASINPAVSYHQLPYSAPHGYLLNSRPLRDLLRQDPPDVLHAHYASGYGMLARRSRWPYLLSVWGSDVLQFPFLSPLHRRLLAANLRSADELCSTSRMMAEHIRGLFHRLPPIHLTPFGIDLQDFRPPENPVDDGCVTIGTVKVLRPVYGVDRLLQGFAICRERLLRTEPKLAGSLRLEIVGDGPQRAELEALARSLGVCDVTRFTGAVPHDRVSDCLAKLDIYVAMSRSESFGVAVLEASACGRPVIVSDVGGLPEVVINGETGLLVNGGSVEQLASELIGLITDPARRVAMGCAGRRFVEQQYDWQHNIGHMIDIYASLAEKRSPTPAAA